MACVSGHSGRWKMKYKDKIIDKLYDVQELAMEHYDPLADPKNKSPDDMEAWRNGIIVQKCYEIRKLS